MVRVGGTRVTLDTIVEAFREGLTPEEIQQQYPSLDLPHVYAAVTYYLHHRPGKVRKGAIRFSGVGEKDASRFQPAQG